MARTCMAFASVCAIGLVFANATHPDAACAHDGDESSLLQFQVKAAQADVLHEAAVGESPGTAVVGNVEGEGTKGAGTDREGKAGASPGIAALAEGESEGTTGAGTDRDGGGISLRPGAAAGTVDVVTFGLFAKGLYDVDIKHNKFTIDIITVLKWRDPRVAALITEGEFRTISGKEASNTIWLPEVVVTNRDIRKYELISTSVKLNKTGDVIKVERATVACNILYKLEEYPFDKQNIAVKIASAKYMLDEVVLRPDQNEAISGARKGLLEGHAYVLDSTRVFAFDEEDGALQKSRGVLELTVSRLLKPWQEEHMIPGCMLLMISWGVFWFPFQNPFITPRLALSILALLSFTNLVIKSASALPGGAPCNWNDVFNETVQFMMFGTIILNILSEILKHHVGVHDLGANVNNEAKILLPCLSIFGISLVLLSGMYKWMSVNSASLVTKITPIVVVGTYLAFISLSVEGHKEVERTKKQEASDKEAADAKAQRQRIRREEAADAEAHKAKDKRAK